MKKTILGLTLGASLLASSAMAHFQMLYLPQSALEKQSKEKLSLVFTHPFADEHTMDMESVKQFYVINPKGQKEDLKKSLKPITWSGNTNSGKGFEITYSFKRLGDYVFVLEPTPYFEKNEDSYIQQFTKVIANLAGAPTGWDKDLGLEAEIVPLTKPYAIWEGGTFTGIVKSNGKPVPYAEIEVEFLNFEVDQKNNAFGKTPKLNAPQDSFVTLGIKANKDGEFTFGIPKAGWWGFAALGVGPKSEFKGKELSQDAVIWVQAQPLQ